MVSSDFRKEARKKLEGKWGEVALITFIIGIFTYVLEMIADKLPGAISFIASILLLIIEIPISYGYLISLIKIYKNEKVEIFDFFQFGFDNFKRAWELFFRTLIKMLAPIVLCMVSGSIVIVELLMDGTFKLITLGQFRSLPSFSGLFFVGLILFAISYIWYFVRSYTFKLTTIIAADDETISAKDCVEQSKKLMTGNRWKLFCLELSFIGWAILVCFTFGIGCLWLVPYMQFATFAFYYYLAGKNNEVNSSKVEKIESTENNENINQIQDGNE